MYIASFDIGQKNFAFAVESIFDESIISKQKIKYDKNGMINIESKAIVETIYKNGQIILLKNKDISNPDIMKMHQNMINELESYKDIFEKCQVVLIEQQMMFSSCRNPVAIKLAQNCCSYFLIKYPSIKVIDFPSYNKTKLLGQEKELINDKYKAPTQAKRKKWSVLKALEILGLRNDSDTIDIINKAKKQDDICDVICQLQAYKIQLLK